MKFSFLLRRFFALILSMGLILSGGPALALRQVNAGLEDNPALNAELGERLGISRAGLEEGPEARSTVSQYAQSMERTVKLRTGKSVLVPVTVDRVRELLGAGKELVQVTEIGAASGGLLAAIWNELEEDEKGRVRLTAVDVNEELLAIGREQHKEKGIVFERADILGEDSIKQWAGTQDILLVPNVLHEVFSSPLRADGTIDLRRGKALVRQALQNAVRLMKRDGLLLLFDGVLPPRSDRVVKIRFKNDQMKERFALFVQEYAVHEEPVYSQEGWTVEIPLHYFARFLSKYPFMHPKTEWIQHDRSRWNSLAKGTREFYGKYYAPGVDTRARWEKERKEIYHYFSREEFEQELSALGLEVTGVQDHTLSERLKTFQMDFEILTEGIDFPPERIFIAARLPQRSTPATPELRSGVGLEEEPSPIIAAARSDSRILQRFHELTRSVYQQPLIDQMARDGYNPWIIGYDHEGLETLPQVIETFQRIRRLRPDQPLKVILEIIPPTQLRAIRNFLRAEQEYLQHGTIKGVQPEPQLLQALQEFREIYRQSRHHASNLALWLLENGFDVIPFDPDDVKDWITRDGGTVSVGGEGEEWIAAAAASRNLSRQAFTAIRRDKHGLEVIERERPDIISVGTAHGVKFDLLLDRDGRRSIYVLQDPFDWDQLLGIWERVHERHRRETQSGLEEGRKKIVIQPSLLNKAIADIQRTVHRYESQKVVISQRGRRTFRPKLEKHAKQAYFEEPYPRLNLRSLDSCQAASAVNALRVLGLADDKTKEDDLLRLLDKEDFTFLRGLGSHVVLTRSVPKLLGHDGAHIVEEWFPLMDSAGRLIKALYRGNAAIVFNKAHAVVISGIDRSDKGQLVLRIHDPLKNQYETVLLGDYLIQLTRNESEEIRSVKISIVDKRSRITVKRSTSNQTAPRTPQPGSRAGLEEVAKAWKGVAATPHYVGVERPFLPLLFPGAGKAAPFVAEASLEFVLLVDSDAGLEEAKLLLKRVGANPQRYRIWRVKGTDFSAAISEAQWEFPDRPIYLVDPAQPDWLETLLGGLEEIGILPIGGLEEAFQATQRYLERAA